MRKPFSTELVALSLAMLLFAAGTPPGDAQDPDVVVQPPSDSLTVDINPAPTLVLPNPDAEALPLPEPAEVLEAAGLYMGEGPDALDGLPFFAAMIPFEDLSEANCGVVVPLTIRAVAHHVDPGGDLGLLAEVDRILAAPSEELRGPSVDDVLGADWEIEVPEQEDDDPSISRSMRDSLEYLRAAYELEHRAPAEAVVVPAVRNSASTLTSILRPTAPAPQQEEMVGDPPVRLFRQIRNNMPSIYAGIPQIYAEAGPRTLFEDLCTKIMPARGMDPNTEFAYRVKDSVYLYYHFCGERKITAQKTVRDAAGDIIAQENGSFTYKYPDGSIALIRSCTTYNVNCAPAHVQMMAADLAYARREFRNAGFDVPGGGMTSVAPEIPVHITQSKERSTGHLGRIWLHRPLKDGGRKMRWLSFHEYFHLVEFTHRADLSFVQGLHNWSANPRDAVSWTAPWADLSPTSFFWGNLESMASFAADSLLESYPSYELSGNDWNDGRGYPFFNSYSSLVYGYLGERFRGADSSLQEMARFAKDYLTPISSVTPYDGYKWAQVKYLELYLDSKGLSLADFIEDYHQDLLYALYKDPPEGNRRFTWDVQRPGNLSAWSWPPKLSSLPLPSGSIGACAGGTAMKKSEAKPIPTMQSTLAVSYTCNIEMGAAGALHLRLPLVSGDLPSRINVRARAFLRDGGDRAPAAPQITLIPSKEGPKAGIDPNDLVAVGYPIYSSDRVLGTQTALTSYGLGPQADIDSVMMIVRYPDFWNRFRTVGEDAPDVAVGGQKPYIWDPIRMEVEIQGIW